MLVDSPICDFGWQAPAFSLANADGQFYTRDDVMGERGLLVAFICNHCPYVHAVIDRLVADAAVLQAQGVGVVAIMSNDYQSYAADSPEKMALFATEHGMGFPYLVDETQAVAQAYGAVCTPDFFGFDAAGGLQYRGRLDDLKMKGQGARVPELLNAMKAVVETGKGPVEQAPSMGCSIKWRS